MLEEQLSSIEKFMMKFLENENAEVAAQQLKQTEVSNLSNNVTTPCLWVYIYIYIYILHVFMFIDFTYL